MTADHPVLLSARELTKLFGGLAAVNQVSLDLWQGRIHAVIGPNGAGKSTLANLLSGDLTPTKGRIQIGHQETTHWPPERIARAGLGRSYQKTNVFPHFTVWENIRLAAQSRQQQFAFNPLAWLNRATAVVSVNHAAERALELAMLKERRDSIAGAASHGEQRQLEIAMTLATEPKVLLLDEPLAGMGAAEAERMIQLLQRIKTDHAMMLVEHDMDAVFALADHLTVMVNGQVIASGEPGTVRSDVNVQTAYLGDTHE